MDVPGLVLRVRRLGDLSQRDLAARVGLSQSSIADIETGRRDVPVGLMVRLLEQAGLSLVAIDPSGDEVRPVSPDTVRDNAGRRLPAHLDAAPPDQVPSERIDDPKHDRQRPRAWFHHRPRRDDLRPERGSPADHPTRAALATRERLRRAPVRSSRHSRIQECECGTLCWVLGPCVPTCPCQCEPGPPPVSAS